MTEGLRVPREGSTNRDEQTGEQGEQRRACAGAQYDWASRSANMGGRMVRRVERLRRALVARQPRSSRCSVHYDSIRQASLEARACCDDHRASKEADVQRYILMRVDEYSVGPLNRQSRLELVGALGKLHEQLRGEVVQREDQHAEGGVSGNDPEPAAGGAFARANLHGYPPSSTSLRTVAKFLSWLPRVVAPPRLGTLNFLALGPTRAAPGVRSYQRCAGGKN
eukprot:scaffold123921_cov66-Phaeocystis_antarctica.AAC.8